MPPRPRQAYLLTSMEGFSNGEAARILEVAETEVCDLVSSAVAAAAAEAPASVLIIEDEYLVARDINRIVCGLGHRVIGQPRTHAAALTAMEAQQADLVIADVHLADGSSGVDTANDILSSFGEVPIIFITAFSDELLNGPRPGPTVLITKPFTVREVRAAVSQVLFFGLTSSARPTAPLLAPKPVVTFAD